MKNLLVIVIGSMLLMLPVSVFANGNGAEINEDFYCFASGPIWGGPFTLYTYDSKSVVTPSGNSNFKCFFVIPDGYEPEKAFKSEGWSCGTFLGLTYDSKLVATPSGEVMLDCKVKSDPNP